MLLPSNRMQMLMQQPTDSRGQKEVMESRGLERENRVGDEQPSHQSTNYKVLLERLSEIALQRLIFKEQELQYISQATRGSRRVTDEEIFNKFKQIIIKQKQPLSGFNRRRQGSIGINIEFALRTIKKLAFQKTLLLRSSIRYLPRRHPNIANEDYKFLIKNLSEIALQQLIFNEQQLEQISQITQGSRRVTDIQLLNQFLFIISGAKQPLSGFKRRRQGPIGIDIELALRAIKKLAFQKALQLRPTIRFLPSRPPTTADENYKLLMKNIGEIALQQRIFNEQQLQYISQVTRGSRRLTDYELLNKFKQIIIKQKQPLSGFKRRRQGPIGIDIELALRAIKKLAFQKALQLRPTIRFLPSRPPTTADENYKLLMKNLVEIALQRQIFNEQQLQYISQVTRGSRRLTDYELLNKFKQIIIKQKQPLSGFKRRRQGPIGIDIELALRAIKKLAFQKALQLRPTIRFLPSRPPTTADENYKLLMKNIGEIALQQRIFNEQQLQYISQVTRGSRRLTDYELLNKFKQIIIKQKQPLSGFKRRRQGPIGIDIELALRAIKKLAFQKALQLRPTIRFLPSRPPTTADENYKLLMKNLVEIALQRQIFNEQQLQYISQVTRGSRRVTDEEIFNKFKQIIIKQNQPLSGFNRRQYRPIGIEIEIALKAIKKLAFQKALQLRTTIRYFPIRIFPLFG